MSTRTGCGRAAECCPQLKRCLVSVSRGGGDAVVVREFDLAGKSFLKDGFYLSEAKSQITYLDEDHVLFGTDFGPGSMTTSGYPRLVKLWKRGAPMAQAQTVYRGQGRRRRLRRGRASHRPPGPSR